MPEEKVTALRIPQAAKEYNVSQDRIVDILTKHGFEIKTQNAKLSAEMQQCLQKELAKDKMVKEKSDQILPPKNKKEEAKTATTEKVHEELLKTKATKTLIYSQIRHFKPNQISVINLKTKCNV